MGDENSAAGPKEGWELERKHIFILSSSGKPIFSRYGDEQELVTTFGLLQAVISISLDAGDTLRCIRAGSRKIVYFIKNSLYFVAMSSTREPEVVLLRHLNFLYNQILLVLTSKVHDVFRNNSAADIRQLLGPDTTRLLSVACEPTLTAVPIAFECLNSLTCFKELREEIVLYLSHTVNESNAAYGILLHKDKIIACSPNVSTQLNLSTSDVLLLTHFVANSKSLRSNDHNWVPLCMPDFNPGGFLQAYVGSFALYPDSEDTAPILRNRELTLILMASSADPTVFKELLRGKKYLEKTLTGPEMANKIFTSIQQDSIAGDRYVDSTNCLHFMFKYRPLTGRKGQQAGSGGSGAGAAGDASSAQSLPTQYVQSSPRFPLDEPTINETMWTQYQRLAVCIRRGASTVESTLFPTQSKPPTTALGTNMTSPGGSVSAKKTDDLTPIFAMKSFPSTHTSRTPRIALNAAVSAPSAAAAGGSSTASITAAAVTDSAAVLPSLEQCTDAALQLMSSPPSSDHALAYTVLDSGMVVVALATMDSELFVTFPSMVTPVEASTTADLLSRTLRHEAGDIFQVAL